MISENNQSAVNTDGNKKTLDETEKIILSAVNSHTDHPEIPPFSSVSGRIAVESDAVSFEQFFGIQAAGREEDSAAANHPRRRIGSGALGLAAALAVMIGGAAIGALLIVSALSTVSLKSAAYDEAAYYDYETRDENEVCENDSFSTAESVSDSDLRDDSSEDVSSAE